MLAWDLWLQALTGICNYIYVYILHSLRKEQGTKKNRILYDFYTVNKESLMWAHKVSSREN